jgi:hypothetical protein
MGDQMQKRVVCASSHDLESDYSWSGIKNENSPTPDLFRASTGNIDIEDHFV